MSTLTDCLRPVRWRHTCWAASALAAIVACAIAPTRNEEGNAGSRPVNCTSAKARASPPAAAHRLAKMSDGVASFWECMAPKITLERGRAATGECAQAGPRASGWLGQVPHQPAGRAQEAPVVAAGA